MFVTCSSVQRLMTSSPDRAPTEAVSVRRLSHQDAADPLSELDPAGSGMVQRESTSTPAEVDGSSACGGDACSKSHGTSECNCSASGDRTCASLEDATETASADVDRRW